ncbi:myb-like protein X [Dunckerocampus dactyliophorus]|uniref:myb-like protein X n=1 Tax=Dunckerocampus dactyliophorus TaxID=161453 RepID=UPI0024071CB6|nr:myb-like protein X [Dunckerocampus dactyliophorus]
MNVNQRDFALRTAAEGDAARYSRDHSLICSLPRLQPGQRFLPTKSHACKAQEDKLNPYRRSEASKVKLPPIRDTGRPRDQSSNCIKELKNQNSMLLQQLKESKSENKLLKNVLHRHTVALQQFQDLEGSISQIQDQHRNEVKALRKLLGETRLSRDRLAKKLQATEKELLDAKDRIQTLQWRVIQNPNLLEKEELTYRLNEITLQLEEKDKRIQFLEKSNMLLQGSLNRHVAIEQRKLYKTNDVSVGLQTQVHELAKKSQSARTRESQTSISAIRSWKQLHKKGKQNKMVQTDEFISPGSDADSRLKSDFSESDDMLQTCQSPASAEYVSQKSRTSKHRKYINSTVKTAVSASKKVPHHAARGQVLTEESAMEEEGDEEEDEEKQKDRNMKQEDENEEEEEEEKQKERNRQQEDENEDEEEEEEEDEEEEKQKERNRQQEDENEDEEEEEEDEEEEKQKERNSGVVTGGKKGVEEESGEEDNEKQEEKNEEEEEADAKAERSVEASVNEKFKRMGEDDYDDEEHDVDGYEEEEEEKGANVNEKEQEEEEEGEKAEGKDVEELEEDDNDKKVAEESEDGQSEDEDQKEKEEDDEEEQEQEQDEEAGTTSRQSSVSCIPNEPKLTPREPKRCSKPKPRRKYNFNPVTTNLHLGKPAYTGVQLRYYKGANVPVREETLYCRNRKRSIELLEDASLSDEQTSQPDAASDGSDLESKHNGSCSWT